MEHLKVDKSRCSICGKEKEGKYNSFAQKTFYKECICEKQVREKKEQEEREKAIATYIRKRTQASKVLKREQGAELSKLVVDEYNKKAIDGAKYICSLLLKKGGNQGKNGLILSGNRGSGKTYIAAAIINEYNRNEPLKEDVIRSIIKAHNNGFIDDVGVPINSRCRFIKEADVIQLWGKRNYTDGTSLFDEYKNTKLLVVDDIGTAYGDSKKIMLALFDLFDYRFSQQLSTVITTNLSKDELQLYLGERTFDRLRCACHFISLTSPESRRN